MQPGTKLFTELMLIALLGHNACVTWQWPRTRQQQQPRCL